jgi:hypothetical protein
MAAGNSTEKITYSTQIPSIEESYIRLIQFDINGDSTIYGPVLNKCETEDFYLNIFPNPNTGSFQVIFSHPNKYPEEILLLDITGKIVKKMSCEGSKENTIFLNAFDEKLNKGFYILKIIFNDDSSISRNMIVKY